MFPLILLGLGRLSQAEEYLSQAQWTVLKTPECSNAIKSKLYRNLGLLYAAKTDYEEALRQLADDVSGTRVCKEVFINLFDYVKYSIFFILSSKIKNSSNQ